MKRLSTIRRLLRFSKHAVQLGRLSQPPKNLHIFTLDFSEQSRHVFVVEWQCAAKQRIQYDPAGPDVDLGTRVQFPRDNLWGSIIWTTTAGSQKFTVGHYIR